ncbi:MAG: N-acetyl-gamma-glutamyl-phosphate reductase [Bacillota bacterium]|nr:N-acetyl-gamma-glutamyl-phosphate reductase [Bacillota bacterium]
MIKAGIVGATGYAGEELVRILVMHSEVEIVGITSNSFAGEDISKVYPNLNGCINMKCESFEEIVGKCDVIFAALPHGLSEDIALECDKKGVVFIDLGADFRLTTEEDYKQWYGLDYKYKELHEKSQYGLCEIHKEAIKKSKVIANPGCYPTSITLGLAPVLKNKLIDIKSIIADSKSGVTGSGRGLSLGAHYPECNDSIKAYKVASHRHVPEIEQELSNLAGEKVMINFTPHLTPMNRGILSTIYCNVLDDKAVKLEEIINLYKEFYKNNKFVRVLEAGSLPETKNVRCSNYCDIGIVLDERTNRLIIVSAIDNLFKGAAGQAVQNMNLVFGLPEDTGLKYIPSSL